MKKYFTFIMILIVINVAGCNNGITNADNQKKEEISSETEEKDKENSQEEISNPYFNSTKKLDYKGDFTFTDSRETENVNVRCEHLGDSEYGSLYQIVFDQIDRAQIPEELLNIGYFYVEKEKIYRCLELSEEQKTAIITLGQVPDEAEVVCQSTEIEDTNQDKGWHKKIHINGDFIKYSCYDDTSATNFYETFVWQKDVGIILYRRGYAAELDAMTLWMEDRVENPHEFSMEVADKSENDLSIYGKWKIVEQTGSGYIYGEFSMDDYVGDIITIDKDYIESDIPLEKTRLENPKYEMKEQSRNDFYMIIHSDYDSFGFEDDTPTMVEVYGENDTWDEFGGEFWIKDKNHLIFLGPVFFLAEKVE